MDLRELLQPNLGESYTFERELGGGGMSRVFVAYEQRLQRRVAIKILSPETAATISAERFKREIRVAASLQQANIVPVLTAGEVNGLPYFTMPFVEGESLRVRLSRVGRLSISETTKVLGDIARALAYAHERGVVHRDIKPDNVLLSGGTAVVTDFGIAKAIAAARTSPSVDGATLTQAGVAVGTPAYMAPEQIVADPDVDHRADFYAFGCTAFEMLAGQTPFSGRSSQRLLAAHVREVPPLVTDLRPDTPPALANLITRCLAKDPSQRPASAAELIQALENVSSAAKPITAALPEILPSGRRTLKRTLSYYAVTFLAVLLLTKAAIIVVGLPDWVFRDAVAVMAIGLPAILATAYGGYVRRARTSTPVPNLNGELGHEISGTERRKQYSPRGDIPVSTQVWVEPGAAGFASKRDGQAQPSSVAWDIVPVQKAPTSETRNTHARHKVSAIAAGVIAVALLVWLAPAIERSPSTISFGQTRQVTLDPGLELDPAVSPDGSLLAYSGSSGGARHIFVRTVAGGTRVEVTRDLPGDHVMPRWAPDGSQQLLVTTETGVFVVPALGGAPRLVAAGATYASWAPDSRHIVYVQAAAKETYNELMVRDLAGGDARKLAEGLDLHTPAWSPDGRLIAYVSGNSPYAYSPSGLGNLGPSAVYVISSERGKPIEVVPKQFLNTSPAWTPDSRSLLLVSTRDGGRNIYQLRLDRDGRPRGAMERLTTGLAVGTISLSADGRQLAYSVFQNLSNIWAVRIPTTGTISVRSAEQITQGNQHIEGLAVSHDGRSIAFDSDRGGNSDIYKMALNGGEPVQLTTDPHDDFYPAWSADDQWIAFHSWRNGSRDVFVVRAEGGKVERVAGDTAQEAYPDWSPDGMRLAYHSNRTGRPQIYVTERNARGEWAPARQVTWQGGTQPKWSPDGHTLLYVRPRGMGVYVTDLAGPQNDSAAARERLVLALPFMHNGEQMDLQMAAWSRDGRILLKNSVGFWDMPATGGTPHLLVRLDDPALPSRRQEFVTDGRRIYFTVDSRLSDIWVMDVRNQR